MGIFKESLDKFIQNQFEARQEVLGIKENRSGVMDGAFHAFTTNKYCNIRMASCVDIQGSEILDLDLKVGNVQLEKEYFGSGLARSYILQGGTLLNPKGAKTPAMRRGFPGGGRPLGGVYGDPLARANAKDGYGLVPMPGITKLNIRTKSAYGSLREAKVDFTCHNLRQLAVLEVLYMRPGYPVMLEWGWSPYIFKGSKGGIGVNKYQSWVSDLDYFWGRKPNGSLVDPATQTELYDDIHFRRKSSQGNYDGIIGLCKNFSYSARPDGGFNCTTELMAVGEVLTTLKGNLISYSTSYFKNKGGSGLNADDIVATDITTHLPVLLDMLQKTHDFKYNINAKDIFGEDGNWFYRARESRSSRTQGDDGKFGTDDDVIEVGAKFNKSAAYHKPVSITGNGALNFYDERVNVYNIPRAEVEKRYREEFLESNLNEDGSLIIKDNIHLINFKEGRTGWQDFLVGATAVAGGVGAVASGGLTLALSITAASLLKQYQDNNLGCTEAFIRLDALCYMMNKYCITPHNKSADKTKNLDRLNMFQTMTYNPYKRKYVMNPYKEYEKDMYDLLKDSLSGAPGFALMNQIADCSTDPYVCMMPKQISGTPEGYSDENVNYPPVANNFGFQGDHFRSGGRFFESFPKDSEETKKASFGSIGHIHVNIRFLLKCHDEIYGEAGKENSDYSIGNFMKKVIDGINKVMAGNVKLGLVTDNTNPGITSIVDLNQDPQVKYEDIFKFNVLANNTAVRNFSFNSAIPSAMASTIAIGAQSADDCESLDAVTFAAINRGIKNRLYQRQLDSKGEQEITGDEGDKLRQNLVKELKEIGTISNALYEYQLMVMSGEIFQDSGEETRNKKGHLKTQVGRLKDLVNIVSMKNSAGVIEKDKKKNPPSSTPIPIKLDMTFDGISGLTMGQLFRVDETRLPQAYRGKNVIFVVVAEDQNIDANGNWTTKISGQMQLFPGTPDSSVVKDALPDAMTEDFDKVKKFCDRFFAAMKGGGTKDSEMDRLYNTLKNDVDMLDAVQRYWAADLEDRTGGESLLQWIWDDENGDRYWRWTEIYVTPGDLATRVMYGFPGEDAYENPTR